LKTPVGVTDPVSVASEVYKYHRLPPGLVEQLVSIYRTMFPHSSVPDELYEHVVRKLDDQAVQDQDLSGLLSNGVEALNRKAGSAWTGLSEEERLKALKQLEQTPFFQRLRSDFVVYFYSNPATGVASDTKVHPMIKADISIVASTTSIGSKERSFSVCHENLIWMTVVWC